MKDAAGAETTTAYDTAHDLPAVVMNADGNPSYYKYDHRGRKIAEWGTALQPACFGYDDMDNMTALRTFRAGTETISSDPSERTDYDQTTWTFHPATGLELSKTYADGSTVVKTYDAYNRIATETDARGNVKTHSYEHARGLHLGTTYSVVDGTADTAARSFNYNHLGQITQVVDDAGTRTIGYNTYGERETDSLVIDGDTHLITENRDTFGRSIGYTYAKNGSVLQAVSTGYGTDGRINSAGFLHGGEMKLFGYEYLQGSNLLHKLTKPNGMTLTQSYEMQRELLISMAYHRGSTLVAQREYDYDMLGRPTARTTSRQGKVVNDTFVRNSRAELVNAQVNGETYNYEYDNVGNRLSSIEAGDFVSYDVNALNQYTNINGTEGETEFGFSPTYDSDGNQTMLKTETGIWSAEYNAENRTVRFTNNESNTVVECAYDFMGRRACKKVTINGTVTLHQRYIYRGYLQIACCDLTRANHPCLWLITWDETQPKASRPLSIQIDGTWYTYGLDLTKNVCELFTSSGYIASTNVYSPFGIITTTGSSKQTLYWNSENYDRELGLMYYIKRYYNPLYSMWSRRDKSYAYGHNLYNFTQNDPIAYFDMIGNVKGNPNHGGLNLYVRHDLDKEEKEDEERKNANTNLNNYINEYKDDKENTQITNPRCWEHGCKTVTFLIELGDPIDNFIEAKVGHATVSVGQNFYDFGPVRKGVWEDGGYYWADPTFNLWEGKWDANHRVTLNDVKQNIKKLAMDHAVVEVITCVCKKHADSFEEKLKQLKNLHYELLWDQCATTVGNLFFDAIESPRLFFATSPDQLFKRLLDTGNITCGPNKGKKPFVRILQKFDTKYKWEYEPIKVE